MFDVITFGSATRDVFIRSSALEATEGKGGETETCLPLGAKINVDELDFDTGGGATNAAATFARMGFRTAAACAIGDDTNGQEIIRSLKGEGVSLKLVQKIEGERTGYSIVILSGSGERTILVHRGAARQLDADTIPWKKLRPRWFYVTSLGGDLRLLEKILNQAERVGARVSWNPGNSEISTGLADLDGQLRRVDVLNLNLDEAAQLTRMNRTDLPDIFARLRKLPKKSLVITDGQNGAYASAGRESWHCRTMRVQLVNTTGAGDAFGSGFVAGLMKLNDVHEALEVGMLNAAGLVQHMGAKHGLLERFPHEDDRVRVTVEDWN